MLEVKREGEGMEESERVRGKEMVWKNIRGKEGRRGHGSMLDGKREGKGMGEG
jgi:hypothetical protein